ncbi:hypothetical protein CDD80_6938 [Ophiocordyceps camponoti-rufipedis]|uniref:Uncharacterized protein n=1 Tax=Ophiocordyceps camponoti-rufipedis TaxID=2004952 RepID=A0A2C5YPH0_9HYPO|nr:hypothetical protein CDD80_6938 [Ophiocordyceps camponoti-rufipedis]
MPSYDYFKTVRSVSAFQEKRESVETMKGKTSLRELIEDKQGETRTWKPSASNWNENHLLACKVICRQPRGTELPLLAHKDFWPDETEDLEDCVQQLIQGPLKPKEADDKDPRPATMEELGKRSEGQLVRFYKPDTLGYVWSGLARLLQAKGPSPVQGSRADRKRKRPAEEAQVDRFSASKAAGRDGEDSGCSSDEYIQRVAKPPTEEATLYFANMFIRCALIYGQPEEQDRSLDLCQEHQKYSFKRGALAMNATDDGRIYFPTKDDEGERIAALIEAKRCLNPKCLPNEVLAQLVGDALALKVSGAATASKTDFVTIYVAGHRMRFLHFRITDNYAKELLKPFDEETVHEEAENSTTSDSEIDVNKFMVVDSSKLLHLDKEDDREAAVKNIIALTRWAQRLLHED